MAKKVCNIRKAAKGQFPPGTYRIIKRDGQSFLYLRCPNCGKTGILKGCKVGMDGVVTPALACNDGKCGFNSHIRLNPWVAGKEWRIEE